jgi:predicted phosphodiesterase
VLGNVDRDTVQLQRAVESAGHVCHGRFGQLTFDKTRVAFLHGDDARGLKTTIDSGAWDLVCYGHTHQARIERGSATRLVLNPGAVYRANPHSVAIVRLPELDVELLNF